MKRTELPLNQIEIFQVNAIQILPRMKWTELPLYQIIHFKAHPNAATNGTDEGIVNASVALDPRSHPLLVVIPRCEPAADLILLHDSAARRSAIVFCSIQLADIMMDSID